MSSKVIKDSIQIVFKRSFECAGVPGGLARRITLVAPKNADQRDRYFWTRIPHIPSMITVATSPATTAPPTMNRSADTPWATRSGCRNGAGRDHRRQAVVGAQ
jgi:hypothetical protein